ncbi:hypothetical protein ACF1BN_03475 [Streptomyces sp. NPDC014861]|uniref:hypothetical protein n=1 Tax=Streptomyces sp. NPDC014861 TaxID=3364923 RepID=UPI0036FB1C4D
MADMTAQVREAWPQVLEAVRARRRFTWILLNHNARVRFYGGDAVTLCWGNHGALDNFVSSGSVGLLEQALKDVLAHPVSVESVVECAPPGSSSETGEPAEQGQTTGTIPYSLPLQPEETMPPLQRVLGQTAFLAHEQGDDQAAALLGAVEDVELRTKDHPGQGHEALLVTPSHLVPRFTEDVIATIRPVFENVARRHGLRIHGVTAVPALPAIGHDWRQTLQTKLSQRTEDGPASPAEPAGNALHLNEDSSAQDTRSWCTRQGKSTGRRCRRETAVWPAYDDLPPPVQACAGHLTPQEWSDCKKARDRSRTELVSAQEKPRTTRDVLSGMPKPASLTERVTRPCTGACVRPAAQVHNADQASTACASCSGYVCLRCGIQRADQSMELCEGCEEREVQGEDVPDPRTRLLSMVNALVKATGTTHRQVNAELNRTIGVASRSGAGEQVILRAADAAQAWLDQLG